MRFNNHFYLVFRAVVQKSKHDGIYSYKVEFTFTTDQSGRKIKGR
jgi:hypothetical protein